MATFPIKIYNSKMEGMPLLGDTWGQMTTMLDAVLVDGVGVRTVSTMTRSGTTVTVTFAASHKYIVNQIIEISGANETGYNGQWRVTGVTTLTFTFEIDNSPASPATGTISCRIPPLGFTRLFSDTLGTSTDQGRRRIYRSNNVSSNKVCLRIEDDRVPNDVARSSYTNYTTTYAKCARVGLAQNFSDSTTPVGAQLPYDISNINRNWVSSGSGTTVVSGWWKWYWSRHPTTGNETSQDTTTNKDWWIIGDDRGFYFFMSNWSNYNGWGWTVYAFTDFQSFKASDQFNTILMATEYSSNVSTALAGPSGGLNWISNNGTGKGILRDFTGVGSYKNVSLYSVNFNNSTQYPGYSTGITTWNPPDYGQPAFPVYIKVNSDVQGIMPGILWPMTTGTSLSAGGFPFLDTELITNVTNYSGKSFMNMICAVDGTNVGRILIDITGPWTR